MLAYAGDAWQGMCTFLAMPSHEGRFLGVKLDEYSAPGARQDRQDVDICTFLHAARHSLW